MTHPSPSPDFGLDDAMMKAISPLRMALLILWAGMLGGAITGFAEDPVPEQQAESEQDEPEVVVEAVEEPAIPPVWLSTAHAALCAVMVGETFPAVELSLLRGRATDLATLRGKNATVILFWHPDRWMARTALIDLERDVVKKFPSDQVAVVGIAVKQSSRVAQRWISRSKVTFPQLIDSRGEALALVGTHALPRIYVLDAEGKIVWFDIEYSEGTRRELQQTLEVLTMAEE